MNDFGLRVGVDGESEFKKALKELNQNMKTLGTEAKLVGSQFDSQDKSVEALTSKNKVLNKQIEEQAKKVNLLKDALQNAKQKYGENSTQAQQWQQKLNLAQAELNNMNRELDKNQKEIEQTAKAERTATSENDKFSKSLKDAGKSADESSSGIKKAGEVMKTVGKTVAAAATAIATAAAKMVAEVAALGKALADMSVEAASYADEILTLSQVTGISTEKLQEYAYAAELIDVSVETLTGSMKKNIKSMVSAAKGTGDIYEAYQELGVSVTDAEGNLRNSEDVYWELIDALGQIEDDTQRDALAMTILGKSAQDLNPLIKAGANTLAQYAEEAHKAGYVMSEETLAAFGDFDNQMQRLDAGATAAKNALGTILLPALTQLSKDGVDLLGNFTNAVLDSNGDLGKLAESIGEMVPDIIAKIETYMPAVLKFVSKVASEVVPRLSKAVVKNLPNLLNTAFDLIFTELPTYIIELANLITQNAPTIIKSLVDLTQRLADWLTDNLNPILGAVLKAIDAISVALTKNTAPLIKAVIQIILAVVDAILDNLDIIIESIIGTIPYIIEALIECTPLILEGIVKLVLGIIKALPSIFVALFNAIKDLFAKGVPEVGKWVADKVKSFMQSDGVKKFIEVGSSIMNGIKEGIVNTATKVVNGVKDAVNKVVNGVKDFLGIHSPSRVFAGIGEYMGEGLEIGFVDSMKDAEKKIASAIPTSFNIDANARVNQSSALNNVSADQNAQISLLRQQNALLQKILDKNATIQIGDDVIGRANSRYTNSRGVILNGGSYAY